MPLLGGYARVTSDGFFVRSPEGAASDGGRRCLTIRTRTRCRAGRGDDAFYMAAEEGEFVPSALKLNSGHSVLCGQVFYRIFGCLNFRLYPQTDVFLMGAQSFLVRFAAREA